MIWLQPLFFGDGNRYGKRCRAAATGPEDLAGRSQVPSQEPERVGVHTTTRNRWESPGFPLRRIFGGAGGNLLCAAATASVSTSTSPQRRDVLVSVLLGPHALFHGCEAELP